MERFVWRAVSAGMILWLTGCGAQKETTGDSTPDAAASLRALEADFDPSALDPPPGPQTTTIRPDSTPARDDRDMDATTVPTETVQGFRVQVFSTTSIDEANAKKSELEEAIPQERVYLEFDPPAYKIRAGNFLNRYDADRFVRFLADKGFPGAWTVPQRVLKNPPPLPPRPSPAPDPDAKTD
jgi:hypothetical protein